MNTSQHDRSEFREELRTLYQYDEAAAAFFDWINSRGKSSRATKARVAADRTGQSYSKILELFRKFDEYKLGAFFVGRRGSETRIEWDSYDVKSLAKIAVGEAGELERITDIPQEEDYDEDTLEHSYNLRPNLTLTLKLPENFSAREAERLTGWIKSLPFDDF